MALNEACFAWRVGNGQVFLETKAFGSEGQWHADWGCMVIPQATARRTRSADGWGDGRRGPWVAGAEAYDALEVVKRR